MVTIFVEQSEFGCSVKVEFFVRQGVEICLAVFYGEHNCSA